MASGASVYLSEDQSLDARDLDRVAFDRVLYDDRQEFNLERSRFHARRRGRYLICYQAMFEICQPGDRCVVVINREKKNIIEARQVAHGGGRLSISGCKAVELGTGDGVDMEAANDDSPCILEAESENTYLTITRLR
jgi:hypothetical protein